MELIIKSRRKAKQQQNEEEEKKNAAMISITTNKSAAKHLIPCKSSFQSLPITPNTEPNAKEKRNATLK